MVAPGRLCSGRAANQETRLDSSFCRYVERSFEGGTAGSGQPTVFELRDSGHLAAEWVGARGGVIHSAGGVEELRGLLLTDKFHAVAHVFDRGAVLPADAVH